MGCRRSRSSRAGSGRSGSYRYVHPGECSRPATRTVLSNNSSCQNGSSETRRAWQGLAENGSLVEVLLCPAETQVSPLSDRTHARTHTHTHTNARTHTAPSSSPLSLPLPPLWEPPPPPPPPPSRTKWTRRVPHPVRIGHAASLRCGRCLAPPLPNARGERVSGALPTRPAAGCKLRIRRHALPARHGPHHGARRLRRHRRWRAGAVSRTIRVEPQNRFLRQGGRKGRDVSS